MDNDLNDENEDSILLSFNNAMALAGTKDAMAELLTEKLTDFFGIDDYTIEALEGYILTQQYFLYDERQDLSGEKRRRLAYIHDHFGYEKEVYDRIIRSGKPVVFDIEKSKGQTPGGLIEFWATGGLKQIIGCSLRIRGEDIGILWLKPGAERQFTKNNLLFLQKVAAQVSIAFYYLITNHEITRADEDKAILLSFSNEAASVRDKDGLSKVIKNHLKERFLIREYLISIVDSQSKTQTIFLYDDVSFPDNDPEFAALASQATNIVDGVYDVSLYSDEPQSFNVDLLLMAKNVPDYVHFLKKMGFDKVIGCQLKYGYDYLGVLWVQPDQITNFLLKGISSHLAVAMANILANEKIEEQLKEINSYKQQLEEEKLYLQQEVSGNYSFDEIIGSGKEMEEIYEQMSQVAFANSTVLILGETGTGKELIARGIHNASSRKDKLMVKVNCASIPENLIESELFGHEKGSFTGAIERRIGKFELANNGTLFLDEIGEMPLDLQVKLLRVLQEKEIERIGGKTVIKINVRVIAATNRDLLSEVKEGNFRNDLYYRLNVFPIVMPPLRNRKEDIPELTKHFIQRYSRSTGKKVDGISNNAMKDLMAYDWPGNVRELEHLLERSILISKGNIIKEFHLPMAGKKKLKPEQEDLYIKTNEENERDHILFVLKKCNGKIFGKGGAAQVLDMHVSTLNSRIRKLGIKKEQVFIVGPHSDNS
jgi:formate hydrogenlyase transcriptional activator